MATSSALNATKTATSSILNPATKILLKESLKIGKQVEKYPVLNYFFSKQQKTEDNKLSIPNIRKRFREKDVSLSKNFEEFRIVNEQLNLCKRDIPWYNEIPKDWYATYKADTINEVTPGCLLLSHPILRDTYWNKVVILILHVDEHNAFGVIVNQWTQESVNPYRNTKKEGFWEGGPVPHVSVPIFTKKDLFPNAVQLCEGFYYSVLHTGNISGKALENIPKSEYRMFVGFCVWNKTQLQNEIENLRDWVIVKNPVTSLFTNPENIPDSGLLIEGDEAKPKSIEKEEEKSEDLEISEEQLQALVVAKTEKAKGTELKGEPFQFSENPTTGTPYDAGQLWSKVLKSHWVRKEIE